MSRIDLFGHDEGQKQANKKIKRLNKKTEGGYNNPEYRKKMEKIDKKVTKKLKRIYK